MKPESKRISLFLLLAIFTGVAIVFIFRAISIPAPLQGDIYIQDTEDTPAPDREPVVIKSILADIASDKKYFPITIDYPFDKSVFPPEIVAPTFLWHDSRAEADLWLIDVSFEGNPYHIYALTTGRQPEPVIDPEAISPTNEHYKRPEYDITAKAWTPDEQTWQTVKQNSVGQNAVVKIYGLNSSNNNQVLSTAHIKIATSSHPVGSPIFYRDVPLMPSKTKGGEIKPIDQDALPLIAWRLRDISRPSAPAVLKEMPTCANCHSFSKNGKLLGMDMDGPQGDKGAYALTAVSKDIVVENDNIITWNSYEYTPKGHKNFGLFSQVSPDGRYVVSTLNESTFVMNYPNFEFLQSFYPTRGILVVYDRKTGRMTPLPGADSTFFVQTNACWSPDGKELVFSKAKAKDNYNFESTEKATYAGDDRETFIQYDLYRIPFNGGKGGIAQPVAGASRNGMSNSFPKFSPDGKWIVFVKSQKGQLMRPDSKLYIIPAQGGTARELKCNLNPMNSWHSWSPNSRWLVFSSKGMGPFTKMFLTHIDENGNDTPAILIPNSTAANRAVNIPEFLKGSGDAIASISAPTQKSYGLFNEANALATKGKWAEALTVINKSIEGNPFYAKAYGDKGFILFNLGRNQEAIEYLKKATELDPKAQKAYNNLAHILSTEGKTEEAISYLNKVLKQDPELPETQFMLAGLYKEKGKNEQAIEHYRLAAWLSPFTFEYLRDLGTALLVEQQYDEAIQCYEKSLKLDARQPNVLCSMGLIYQLKGDNEKAIEYFQKGIELDDHLVAHYNLACLLQLQGDISGAISHFRKFLEIMPDNIDARKKLAIILLKQKELQACAEQYETILKLQSQSVTALNGLAWVLSAYKDNAMADPERAVKLAMKACELTDHKVPVLLDTLAVSYAATGNYEQAVLEAEKALKLLESVDDKLLAEQIRERLSLFRNNQSYSEPTS